MGKAERVPTKKINHSAFEMVGTARKPAPLPTLRTRALLFTQSRRLCLSVTPIECLGGIFKPSSRVFAIISVITIKIRMVIKQRFPGACCVKISLRGSASRIEGGRQPLYVVVRGIFEMAELIFNRVVFPLRGHKFIAGFDACAPDRNTVCAALLR